MPSLTLPDGTKIPVTPEYAARYKTLPRDQQIAETKRLAAEQQPAAAVDQPPAAAGTSPPASTAATADQPVGHVGGDNSQLADILLSARTGLRSGLEGIPGMPGDLAKLGRLGLAKVMQLGGANDETTKAIQEYDIPFLPDVSSDTIHQLTTNMGAGPSYEPQTTAGKFARTAAEFAPGLIPTGGPLRIATKLATNVGAGLASEAAGELTEGTALEGPARLAAGVAGGAVGEGAAGAAKAAKTAPARAAEAAAEDAAGRHGVKLTKGERTGDVTQQKREQDLLHGAKGAKGQTWMQRRRRANIDALKQGGVDLADRAAPNRAAGPAEQAQSLVDRLRGRVKTTKDKGGQQIDDALKGGGVMVDADLLRDLPEEIRQKLIGADLDLPEHTLDDLTPVSNAAMKRIDTFVSKFDDPAKFADLSLQKVDRLRRQVIDLAKDAKPGSQDSRALGAIIDHFDDWLLNAAGKGSIKQGPNVQGGRTASQVAADLKTGQQTYKEGARIDSPRGAEARQPGAGDVKKMATGDASAEATLRRLRPNARGSMSDQAVDILRRLEQTGGTKEELDQVRAIILDGLTGSDEPGRTASRIMTFMAESPTAKKLFTQQELDDLASLGETGKRLTPKPEALNPSRTGYSENMIKSAGSLVEKTLRSVPGGSAIVEGFREASGARKAKEALSPADRRTVPQTASDAAKSGAGRQLGQPATRGMFTLTINDPEDPYDGQQVTVISEGQSGFLVRLPNGKEKLIGKKLVKPNG